MTKEPEFSRPDAALDESRSTVNRRGRRAIGATVTAGVLALVVLLNILFSFVADRYMWQLDTTVTRFAGDSRSLYTPSEEYLAWAREEIIPMVDQLNEERAAEGKEPLTINIKFCAERDEIYASDSMRVLQYSAMALQKEFPRHVKVSYIDIEENPSAVQKYKATSASRIYPHYVILEFGSEFRVRSYDTFFADWAYVGEQKIISILMDLTRAISPVAAFITNHGENVQNANALRALVENTGYEVVDIDLSRDPIPENCRLLICYDPQTDFLGLGNSAYTGTTADKSEIDKLDQFLDEAHAFMLFVDKDTPRLNVLEEYMEEWGVTIARGELADGTVENYVVRDQSQKMDKDGYTPIADYPSVKKSSHRGYELTKSMQNVAVPAKIIFPNATALAMSQSYITNYVAADTSENTPAYTYGKYQRNGVSRSFWEVLRTSQNAVAEVGGTTYEISTEQRRFCLMARSIEARETLENAYDENTVEIPTNVMVFGSTEFASDTVLQSAAYGNADVLSAALLTASNEAELASLDLKGFKIYEVNTDIYQPDAKDMTTTTVVLIALPIVICATVGAVVSIKRKYR